MRQALMGQILAAATVGIATALGSCSTNTVIDSLPAGVAEPANAPVRPVSDTYQYPAVHDMPPPRPDQLMTDEQEAKMEQDLANIRDRQEKQLGVNSGKKDAKIAKKKPPAADESQTTGDKTNP
jgi:hypothetical protein